MERIRRVRLAFVIENRFLGTLAFGLRIVASSTCASLATDGRHLYVNTAGIENWTFAEKKGVVAHEVVHCLLQHTGDIGKQRAEGKKTHLWDIAKEYMVNHVVRDMFKLSLPGNPYYLEKYNSNDWTTELIYHDLCKEYVDMGFVFIDDHTVHTKNSLPVNVDWKILATRAAQVAKSFGTLPEGLEFLLEDMIYPKITLVDVLSEFVSESAAQKNSYTWQKPHRRYIVEDIYVPSLMGRCLNIGFAVDTSGSMSDEQVAEGFSLLQGICSSYDEYCIHVWSCDVKIHKYEQVISEHINFKGFMKGRGGTSFVPVFEDIEKRGIQPDCLVYYTDLEGTFPSDAPAYPVLWVTQAQDCKIPFGRLFIL